MKKIQKSSTHFLRFVVLCMGAVALLLFYFVAPILYTGWAKQSPDYFFLTSLALITTTIIPFFVALWQTLKLLSFIDKNEAFSTKSIRSFTIIRNCAIVFSALYAVCLPFFYAMAQDEDAPGIMVIGIVMTFAPIVIAVFAAVLQKLLQSAVAIKSENDLTV